jgi:hypothetical protein
MIPLPHGERDLDPVLLFHTSFDEKERGIMLLFLSVLQTLLLLLIAAGTGYLIYRSSGSARGTRRSLHSRRSEVYKDVVRILALLAQKGDLGKEELLDFRSRTQDAALLFDEEIAAYIEEIYSRGVKLMSTNEILEAAYLACRSACPGEKKISELPGHRVACNNRRTQGDQLHNLLRES